MRRGSPGVRRETFINHNLVPFQTVELLELLKKGNHSGVPLRFFNRRVRKGSRRGRGEIFINHNSIPIQTTGIPGTI